MNYILVPDGLSVSPGGDTLNEPSFVFKAVLDYLVEIIKNGDNVLIAPANKFGGEKFEQDVAYEYLMSIIDSKSIILFKAVKNIEKYIDTFGNALYLKESLNMNIDKKSFELVCAKYHSFRASYCFKKVGFNITKVHRVQYQIPSKKIVRRLWYYRYRNIHILYEIVAYMRDIIMTPFRLLIYKWSK